MEDGEGQGRGAGLETVRALHQTVVALRSALEESKNEILELKNKSLPVESIQEALRKLSIENQQLKQKLSVENCINSVGISHKIDGVQPLKDEDNVEKNGSNNTLNKSNSSNEATATVTEPNLEEALKEKKVKFESPKKLKTKSGNIEAKISITAELISANRITRSLESLTIIKSPLNKFKNIRLSKAVSVSNLSKCTERKFSTEVHENKNMSERNQNFKKDSKESVGKGSVNAQNDLDQTDEVDDIELIFTTDDTKDSDFKEQLVSINAQDSDKEASNLLQLPLSDAENLDISDRELDDDVFNENFGNEYDENLEWKREQSQMCDSKSDMSINQEKSLKSYYSYQDSSFENRSLEKDESFDRFEEKIQIVETDISKCGIHDIEYSMGRRNTCPNPIQYRPILHREAISKGLTITHKSRPILNQSNAIRKESGAQTDISALPGSFWRSESSLAHKSHIENITTLPSKHPLPTSRLHLSEKTVEARRVLLSDIRFTSMVPELSRSADHLCPGNIKPATEPVYGRYLKATDLYSPGCTSQKFTWGPSTNSPSEGSQSHSQYGSLYPLQSPSVPTRRCSAPVSPSKRNLIKSASSKVRFANGSLPELRTDWTTVDSGDSTDSLVEEAENYLRRSIDCLMIGRNVAADEGSNSKKFVPRRASAPEPSRDNIPPIGWQPFLPRVPRDLKLDHWVKVITHEGKVRGGRVRYVGPIVSQAEQFVGVQLASPEGYCDGSFNSRRYFQCEPYHGIFVPFKKVIMGWRP